MDSIITGAEKVGRGEKRKGMGVSDISPSTFSKWEREIMSRGNVHPPGMGIHPTLDPPTLQQWCAHAQTISR